MNTDQNLKMTPGPRPSPLLGEDRPEPGYWAERAIDGPWIADRAMTQYQGRLLAQLRQLKPRREPGTRVAQQKIEGEKFYKFIGANLTNIEALVAQTVGDVNQNECQQCVAGNGPFTSCVSVNTAASSPVLHSRMSCCANCHFVLKGTTPPGAEDTLVELRHFNDRIMHSLREARYHRELAQVEYDEALARLLAADRRMGDVLSELEDFWISHGDSDSDSSSE